MRDADEVYGKMTLIRNFIAGKYQSARVYGNSWDYDSRDIIQSKDYHLPEVISLSTEHLENLGFIPVFKESNSAYFKIPKWVTLIMPSAKFAGYRVIKSGEDFLLYQRRSLRKKLSEKSGFSIGLSL